MFIIIFLYINIIIFIHIFMYIKLIHTKSKQKNEP